ncbi:MAG: YkvA family protein [Actinomycetota bacterium]|nr:YkvA family protein [Actinomycetota bacterium]
MAGQPGNVTPMTGRMKGMESTDLFGRLTDGVMSVGKLLIGLFRDPRVPQRNKILAGAIVGYFFLPFDFIPDFVPGIGYLDDFAMLGVALHSLLNLVPEEVIEDHWDGDPTVLDFIRGAAATVTNLVPDRVREMLLPEEQE